MAEVANKPSLNLRNAIKMVDSSVEGRGGAESALCLAGVARCIGEGLDG